MRKLGVSLMAASLAWLSAPAMSHADNVILDDLIVDGSACVGMDCVNGESFGFDTLRLKENNLRIHFNDTSNSASFPSNDWRIVINGSNNGDPSYFAIEDSTAGRIPFRVEAGASANALVVEADSDIGIGTLNPVVELHVVDGDSPTLRLEQDGSSGFTAQTFDIAANETNFFVRDVTNGSQLPFRIKPGADTDALFIAADNNIGMGTDAPGADLHIRKNGATQIRVDNFATGGAAWNLNSSGSGDFRISDVDSGTAVTELALDGDGNLTVAGNFISGTTTLNVPDYVFQEDYNLMSLADLAAFIKQEKHLPNIPSATEVNTTGQLNMSEMQLKLLEKVEELTLYTLEQEKTINKLQERLAALEQ